MPAQLTREIGELEQPKNRWYNTDLRHLGRVGTVIHGIVVSLIAIFVIYLLAAASAVAVAKWTKTPRYVYPIMGLSMDNTIEQTSRLLKIGAFVLVDRYRKPVLRDIVILEDPRGGWDVKRVSWISTSTFKIDSDNYKVTGADSSTEESLDEIPLANIRGVVTGVISWQWIVRSWSSRGRAENWLRFHYRERPIWSPTKQYAALDDSQLGILVFDVRRGQPTLVCSDPEFKIKDSDSRLTWRNGKAVWQTAEDWSYAAVDLETGRVERFHAFSTRISELGWLDKNRVVVVGDATRLLYPGDLYRGRRVKDVVYPYPCTRFAGPSDLTHTKVVLR